MTTLHLIIGLPCSGKTTLAKKLEVELGALRLTPDEWHRHLYGQDATHPEHDDRHEKIEALQWQVAATALERGLDVILDFGLWAKVERQDYRERAAALGAEAKIHFLDVPFDELLVRLDARNKQASDDVTFIPLSMMREYLPHFQAPDAEEIAENPN
ncbi:MAG: AAA family ATPase [Pseudomonadales bacterium]|nr:AAA family ATPase [Pseudomonadales bacterium]